MNKIAEDTIGISRIMELLNRQYRLLENTDNLLYYSRGIVERGKEMLAINEAWSLMYLSDLCKKGYYEHLKVRKETAKGYFGKIISYRKYGSGSETSDLLHDLLGGLFISYHYSVLQMADQAADMIRQSPDHCEKLYSISNDPFFQRLHVFMWLSYRKILIKQGESAFAMNEMTDTLTGWLRKNGSVGTENEENIGYSIVSVFNVLYSFSLLSPSFRRNFKTAISEAAVENRTADDPGNFIACFIKAQKAIAAGDVAMLSDEFMNMLSHCSEARQLYMLASVFNEVYSLLVQAQDHRSEEIRILFQNLARTELPAYLLNKVFDVNMINKELVVLTN